MKHIAPACCQQVLKPTLLHIRALLSREAADPAPGVAVPVVAVGPAADIDVDAADGLLPGVADFDPALAVSGGDEVSAAAPDGADFDPASLDSV